MYHKPALLNESIEGLDIQSEGIYVDVTFGGGGHSKAILEELKEGRLIAFDQDPDALENTIDDQRFTLVNQNFAFLKNYLRMYRAIPINGLLADLGVSFHQFDRAERGFSFRFEGPLDMRMDKKRPLTAAKILNSYSEEKLLYLFQNYGELRNAKSVVAKIISRRAERKFKFIADLKNALQGMVPAKVEHKFFAQVFQSLRIEVNQEMQVIQDLIEQSVEVLAEGGRIAVITYHSLEDRLIKNFFKTGNFQGELKKDFFGNIERPLEPVNRKPIIPSESEINENNRSRSAKLRIAKKRIQGE